MGDAHRESLRQGFRQLPENRAGADRSGLNALTGAPFEYLNKEQKASIDIDVAWSFITSNFELNYLLVGSTENNDRNGYLGLVS